MENNKVIYFDNSATSWPKPPEVAEAMVHFLNDVGANPGRSGHTRAVEASQIVYGARENLARLFNVEQPEQIIFTKNITEALNCVLFSLVKPGDHVITTSMEHNSVMRPLRHLEKNGVELSVIRADDEGFCSVADMEAAIKPNTKFVVSTHSSNVTGTIQDIAAMGDMCRRHGLRFIVDSAQSAGALTLDVKAMHIDALCFTGHKGLLGPMGTGGCYLTPEIHPEPFLYGGTGSLSDLEEHPTFMPDVWEAGTCNAVGLAGLQASTAYLLRKGTESIRAHEIALTQRFMDGVRKYPAVKLYGPLDAQRKTAVTALNIDGMVCSNVGQQLNEACGMMVRPGLHCAPTAHKTLGTFPTGCVRFSFSGFTTEAEVDEGIKVIGLLATYAAAHKEG